MNNDYLMHYGVKGMKWGVRKKVIRGQDFNKRVRIEKGTELHRVIPRSWSEREKNLHGHMYASYKEKDVKKYRSMAKLFGDGSNYVDMSFKVKDIMMSPSEKERIETFINMVSTNQQFNKDFRRATRFNPFVHVSKRTINNLDINDKKTDKAYDNFEYLLVRKRSLRDPYFDELRKAGYSFMVDDADRKHGITESPIIVFDREKSLSFKAINEITNKGGL